MLEPHPVKLIAPPIAQHDVVWRHPCNCATASRPLEPSKEAEHRFDVDGALFPWYIAEAGASFHKDGEFYLVDVEILRLLAATTKDRRASIPVGDRARPDPRRARTRQHTCALFDVPGLARRRRPRNIRPPEEPTLMPSLQAAPLEERVMITEYILRDYLVPNNRLVTKYGDVSQIKPERDPNVPTKALIKRRTLIDDLNPGYGYTGRVIGAGPVILLADETLNQVLQYQHRTARPWPYGGVLTRFDPDTRLLTIDAANGSWTWLVVPAYWPTMRDPAAWCIGILERGEAPA